MEIHRINESEADRVAPLVAEFRVALRSYKGIRSKPDVEAGREEILDDLKTGYPVFTAEQNGEILGYVICRIEEPVLWVEQIYVRETYRRSGVASLLFEKAEELAHAMGEETMFNYVHPNNDGMIGFLRSKGYTVLNLIEIRKPYSWEKPTTEIKVNDHVFDY